MEKLMWDSFPEYGSVSLSLPLMILSLSIEVDRIRAKPGSDLVQIIEYFAGKAAVSRAGLQEP
jgi:hypothetical protein